MILSPQTPLSLCSTDKNGVIYGLSLYGMRG
jgi:hypothetical protein